MAFGRSSLSPLIFTVKPAFREMVWAALVALGVKTETRSEDRGGSPGGHAGSQYQWWAAQLLDGYVVRLAWGSRFPNPGELPNGMWVVGVRALYLLVRLLELEPPSRQLRGVPEWDQAADLLAESRAQIAAGEEHPGAAYDITESAALLRLAWNAFGNVALPLGGGPHEKSLPGARKWGELGFTRARQSYFESLGIGPDDAVRWGKLFDGPWPWDFPDLVPLGLDTLERWVAAGFSYNRAKSLLQAGCPLEIATALLRAGIYPGRVYVFLAADDPLAKLQEYVAAGFHPDDAAEYFRKGLEVPDALQWAALGFTGEETSFIVSWEGDLEGVRRAIATGLRPDQAASAVHRAYFDRQKAAKNGKRNAGQKTEDGA